MDVERTRDAFLSDLVSRYAKETDATPEIGCRSGANPATLHRAGFTRLTGVDGSPKRLVEFRQLHQEA